MTFLGSEIAQVSASLRPDSPELNQAKLLAIHVQMLKRKLACEVDVAKVASERFSR